MRLSFYSILLVFFLLFLPPNLQAFLRPKLNFSFKPTSQILFGTANDAYGFKLSADYDDLRSATAYLSYIFPQDLPLSLESSLNLLTYRGYEHDYEYLRKRTETLDLSVLYHFPINLIKPTLGHLSLNLGSRLFLSGNLGGVYIQKIVHKMIGQTRPIPLSQDPFRADIFMTLGWKYLWRETLMQQGEIHISPLGSYFLRTSLGFILTYPFITSQVSLYWQQTQLTKQQSFLDNHQKSVLLKVAEAENGLGLTYSFENDYFFFFQDLKLFPFHSEPNSSLPLDLFSLGGIGLKILQENSHSSDEKTTVTHSHKNIPASGFSLKSVRFGWEFPFGFTHSWLWKNPSLSWLNLQSGFTFNNEGRGSIRRINRFFANASFDFWRHPYWSFFTSTGAYLSLDQNFESSSQVWRPKFLYYSLAFGLQLGTGIWIEFEKTSQATYKLVLYNHFRYSLTNTTLTKPSSFLKNRFLFKPIAIGLEIGSL